jgi:hypothetical protein
MHFLGIDRLLIKLHIDGVSWHVFYVCLLLVSGSALTGEKRSFDRFLMLGAAGEQLVIGLSTRSGVMEFRLLEHSSNFVNC